MRLRIQSWAPVPLAAVPCSSCRCLGNHRLLARSLLFPPPPPIFLPPAVRDGALNRACLSDPVLAQTSMKTSTRKRPSLSLPLPVGLAQGPSVGERVGVVSTFAGVLLLLDGTFACVLFFSSLFLSLVRVGEQRWPPDFSPYCERRPTNGDKKERFVGSSFPLIASIDSLPKLLEVGVPIVCVGAGGKVSKWNREHFLLLCYGNYH